MPELQDEEHWRLCAEQSRALAEATDDDQAKRILLIMAEEYERVVRRAAQPVVQVQARVPRHRANRR